MDERREAVRLEGVLRDCGSVRFEVGGRALEALAATVVGSGRYGDACHVTFPPMRDLDLWVVAVLQAWSEGETRRLTLAGELPEWMRPGQARLSRELRIVVWGQLRCGQPSGPYGVRPATVWVERAQFPGLDGETVLRAEQLWRASRRERRGV